MTARVLVLVEGQTEERFVKDILQSHLLSHGVFPIPKIVTTKRTKQGPDFKGGVSNYAKVDQDLRRLMGDTNAAAVTTLFDYYGLPNDFPGIATRPQASPEQRATHVEQSWSAVVGDRRFRPYLMIHEFEALLFVNPQKVSEVLHEPTKVMALQGIRNQFSSPEDIDEGPNSAPSKRILEHLPAYQKNLHGPLVLRRIGLDALRAECAHFSRWLTWLEALA